MRTFADDLAGGEYYEIKLGTHMMGAYDFTGVSKIPVAEQKLKGDLVFNRKDGTTFNVEVKSDNYMNVSGNLCIEDWSNKGYNKGWLHGYDEVDYICFIDTKKDLGYFYRWPELQKHVLDNNDSYRVVGQNTADQMNNPLNYLVPMKTVEHLLFKTEQLTK